MSSQSERLPELFHEALGLLGSDRSEFIDRVCGSDTELRTLLLKMIAAAENEADDPSKDLTSALLLEPGFDFEPDELPGYELQERIGVGGMGIVFRAEQQSPRRPTAVKILRSALSSPEARYRFAYEAEVLGRLRHPHIAAIYEAGTFETTSGSQPFFAMELVEGQDVLAYAEQHQLELRPRLRLIAEICDAIQCAHESGVVHRDLKPANLFVDRDGNVKVLDFGVARALDPETETDRPTCTGQLVGTLAYMSPEQAAGDPVDGRTDVYALGIVAYELLAGVRPYNVDESSLQASLETITTHESPPLGAKDRRFRGDVETMIGKALEKNPDRRYRSVRDFGDDIARFLQDEPIAARPPSTVYKVTKFVRRHRAMVGSAATALLLLVGGLIGTGYGLVQMDAARSAAVESAEESKRTLELVERLFRSVQGQGQDARVVDALHSATTDLEGRSDLPPKVASRMRHVLGLAYYAIGDYQRSSALLERAISEMKGRPPRESWALEADFAVTRAALGYGRQARDQLLNLQSFIRDVEDEDLRLSLRIECDLATIESRLEPGTTVDKWRRVRDLVLRSLDSTDPLTRRCQLELANALSGVGAHEEAITLARESSAAAIAEFGEDDLRTAESQRHLAWVLDKRGDYTEGDALLRDVLATQLSKLPSDHPEVLETKCRLAIVHETHELWDDAEQLLEEVLLAQKAGFRPFHPRTVEAKTTLGRVYWYSGRREEALELFEELTRDDGGELGPHTAQSVELVVRMAIAKRESGDLEVARDDLIVLVEQLERRLGEHSPTTLWAKMILGIAHESLNDHSSAVAVYETVVQAPKCWVTTGAKFRLAQLTARLWNFGKAEKLLREALRDALDEHGESHSMVKNIRSHLSMILDMLSRYDESLEVARADYRALLEAHGSADPRTQMSRIGLVLTLVRAGQTDEAEELIHQVIPMLEETSIDLEARITGLSAVAQLALIRNGRGQFESALPPARRAYQEGKEVGVNLGLIQYWATIYGETLIGLGEYDEAEPLLLGTYEYCQANGQFANLLIPALEQLTKLCEATSRPEDAEKYRQELKEFLELYNKSLKEATEAGG